MSTILDINPAHLWSSKTPEQRLALLMTCRSNRIKAPVPAARATRKPATSKPTTMTEDQLMELITSNPALVAKLLGGA